jgi:AraC-like DNA-binding protein
MASDHPDAPSARRLPVEATPQTSAAAPSLVRPSWMRPPSAAAAGRPDTAVVTVLTPSERPRVDAAGEGCYVALHRESIEEAMLDLRQCRAQAVLVSVSRCDERAVSSVARMVREFPTVPAVALLSDQNTSAAQAVLSLGHYGVQSLVDVRESSGWRALRQLFSTQRGSDIDRRAIVRLATELADAPEDCRRFFEGCFLAPARVSTVRMLSRRLGVGASTLMSRFYRAGLPAPKRYLAYARLVRAAALFENPGLSISQVANALEFSSPQSFGRHVQTMVGVTALTFRRTFDGERMLERFVTDLVAPHREVLEHFRPLVVLPTWTREQELARGAPTPPYHPRPSGQPLTTSLSPRATGNAIVHGASATSGHEALGHVATAAIVS